MKRGAKHVFAVLMALLVMGVSSKAAVCDLACALAVHPAGCAVEGPAAASEAMETPGMHCRGRMATSPGHDTLMQSSNAEVCRHAPVYAIADDGSLRVFTARVEWSVVEVPPVRGSSRGDQRMVEAARSVRFHPLDPRLLSLRV